MRFGDSFLWIGTTLIFLQSLKNEGNTPSFIKDLKISFNGKDVKLPLGFIYELYSHLDFAN